MDAPGRLRGLASPPTYFPSLIPQATGTDARTREALSLLCCESLHCDLERLVSLLEGVLLSQALTQALEAKGRGGVGSSSISSKSRLLLDGIMMRQDLEDHVGRGEDGGRLAVSPPTASGGGRRGTPSSYVGEAGAESGKPQWRVTSSSTAPTSTPSPPHKRRTMHSAAAASTVISDRRNWAALHHESLASSGKAAGVRRAAACADDPVAAAGERFLQRQLSARLAGGGNSRGSSGRKGGQGAASLQLQHLLQRRCQQILS